MTWNSGDLLPGPLPLWWQISERLRRAIEHGEFAPGDVLPSEARLNAVFGVSRTTARAALDKLAQDGLISRKSGKGSIVLDPTVDQPLSRLSSFAEDMRLRGLRASYSTFSVEKEAVSDDVASALDLAAKTRVLHVQRLLKADDLPMAMSHSWIHPDALRGDLAPTVEELDSRSLYDWLDVECGARIVGGHETIEAVVVGPQLASVLRVPVGSAALVARRRSHGADGKPIEYAAIFYRADRYRFSIDLVRQ